MNIAGCVRNSTAGDARSRCRQILEAGYGLADPSPTIIDTDTAAFGSSGTPSAGGVRLAPHSHILLAADARIDNRAELAASLGLPASSDELTLILAAWERWGSDSIDRLVGDFALAVWDDRARVLTLARDPTGQRPLFYHWTPQGCAFASMPGCLAAFSGGFDRTGFAEKLSYRLDSSRTYFKGIRRLLPGHMAIMNADRLSVRKTWNPSTEWLRLSDGDFVDAYRENLDAAVLARVTDNCATLGCELSAGLDSNGVTSTAARISSAKIIAYTSAPAKDYAGPVPPGRFSDESALAALTAQRYGLDHVIDRNATLTAAYLKRQARAFQEPARNLVNAAWTSDLLRAAHRSGARTMLTGALGNLTLNFGGLPALANWIAAGRPLHWWREARAAARQPNARWRGVMYNSFAPWMPTPIWRRLFNLRFDANERGWFLNPALRAIPVDDAPFQPRHDRANGRIDLIARLDPGQINRGSLADCGVASLDPMSDRRLVEFALRLPPDQMLRDGIWRPLARRALADRVPAEVLHAPGRGAQSIDWPRRFTQAEARVAYEEIASDGDVADLLDLKRIEQAIDDWPSSDAEIFDRWDRISHALPIALATGYFIQSFKSELGSLAD